MLVVSCMVSVILALHESHIDRFYLIYKDECLFVCLYVCLCLIQIHISEPIGTKLCTHLPRGLEETVGPQYFTFPTFSTYFGRSGWRFMRSRWLPAPHSPLLRYIRDAARAGVTSRTVGCAMKTRRSERNACVWKWKPDETGRKWLMNCTCIYIAFIQMIT